MALPSPLSPRLDAALLQCCHEAEERQYLRKALQKQRVTSSTILASVDACSSTSSPSFSKVRQQCTMVHVEISPRLRHIINKHCQNDVANQQVAQALTARSITSCVQLANKYDEENEVNDVFNMPSMLAIWTESNCVASSLAMHFALSHEPGEQRPEPALPGGSWTPTMNLLPVSAGGSGEVRVMQ